MLRYALPGLSPNGCNCLSVNSRFARIDSYICRHYGFSVAQGGLKTISMAIPFLCPFHSCVHFFHIRLSWSLDILERFTVPWSCMVSGHLETVHSPVILNGPWTPWNSLHPFLDSLWTPQNSSQSHEIMHRCTEHSPLKSCSHHLRWSLDSSKWLTDSPRILYSSAHPST